MSSLFVLWLALAATSSQPPSPSSTSETETFRLYKFQQPIGFERSVRERRADGSTEIRTSFAFTDRWTTVPLSSILRLGKDGSPLLFQLWGSTSRSTSADDRVSIEAGSVTVVRDGAVTTSPAPGVFFTASGYAPVAVTEELWRYWQAHGKPAGMPLFPAGRAAIERRGVDDVTDDGGKPVRLERFTVAGLEWGRETLWVDAHGNLAALKSVDAEFDHFEAVRDGYAEALPRLIASAAADGMAALKELSAPLLSVPEDGKPVAYVGATLIDGRGGPPVQDAAVVVSGGKIAAAGPRRDVRIPSGARRVDLAGKFLLPGLWDMHAHFEQVEWGPLYLAAGVTTVRDCGNEMDFIGSVRDTIDAGKGLGPTLLLACFVDGESPGSIGTTRLREESEIPALITKFREARCTQVKIYQSVPPRLIAPLAKAAHEAGLTVTGHVPNGIGAVHAVEAGMDQINHIGFLVRALLSPSPSSDPDASLSGAARRKALQELDLASEPSRKTIALFKSRGLVVDPTMALAELGTHTPEENARREPGLAKVAEPLRAPLASMGSAAGSELAALYWKADLDVLRALHTAGIPIVAGTDQAVPGHSLHREMEIYVEAGFTPMEAIQAATLVPARAMGREKESGTVEAGKRADLVVVDADPLADIRNLRRVSTVVQAGRAYDTAKLWRLAEFTP